MGNQTRPDVCCTPDGRFVVVWTTYRIDRRDGSARMFSSTGVPQGPEFGLNTFTTNNQEWFVVPCRNDGEFVAILESFFVNGDDWGIVGQRFSSAGLFLDGEITAW